MAKRVLRAPKVVGVYDLPRPRRSTPPPDADAEPEPATETEQAPEPPRHTPPPKPEIDIQAIKRQTYDEGLAAGREQGIEQGIEQGVEQGRKDGAKQGFEDGYAKATQETHEQLDTLMDALHQAVNEIAALRTRICSQVEHEAAQLAFDIAKKVLEDESIAPAVVLKGIVASALAEARQAESLELHLNPDDIAVAGEERIEELLGPTAGVLTPDAAVPRGTCSVNTNYGRIEVDLNARWEAIAASLHEEMTEDSQT